MPIVTVAIPFHTGDYRLFDAIASVLAQSLQDFRLILLDDGAPIEFLKQVRSIKDPRIEVVSDGMQLGLALRLNQSFELVDSKFYARMDADDLMHPSRLELQVRAMEETPSINVLGTSAYLIDSNDRILGVREVLEGEVKAVRATSGTPFIHPSVMMRSSWLLGRRYRSDLKRTEDKGFWISNFEPGSFSRISDPLLFYRVRYSLPQRIVGQTALEERRLVRELADSRREWLAFGARSILKEIVQRPVEASGLSRFLPSRRGAKLESGESSAAQTALADAVGNSVRSSLSIQPS